MVAQPGYGPPPVEPPYASRGSCRRETRGVVWPSSRESQTAARLSVSRSRRSVSTRRDLGDYRLDGHMVPPYASMMRVRTEQPDRVPAMISPTRPEMTPTVGEAVPATTQR
jgi:hypothetical protein